MGTFSVRKQHELINGLPHKECGSCKCKKPLEAYGKSHVKWDGLHYQCKECNRTKEAARRARDKKPVLSPEERSAIQKIAYTKSREKIAASFIKNGVSARIAGARSKPVIATNLSTGEEIAYASAKLAEIDGFSRKEICRAIKSNKPHGGFFWRFV